MNKYTINFGDDTAEAVGDKVEVDETYTVITAEGEATYFAKTSEVRSITVVPSESKERTVTVKLNADVADYVAGMTAAAEATHKVTVAHDHAQESIDSAREAVEATRKVGETLAFTGGFYKDQHLLMFAEPDTAWEAYISGNPGARERYRKAWEDIGKKLGLSDD